MPSGGVGFETIGARRPLGRAGEHQAVTRRGRLITRERERLILADARLAVERLALPRSEQFQWLTRHRLRPIELVESLVSTLRTALSDFGDHFSPTLRLRLEALENELSSLSSTKHPAPDTPEAILKHSSWAVATHLAGGALREVGWPSL